MCDTSRRSIEVVLVGRGGGGRHEGSGAVGDSGGNAGVGGIGGGPLSLLQTLPMIQSLPLPSPPPIPAISH